MSGYSDKPVRRSQLISPFGVGSMIDFPKDVALMIAGLDAWPHVDRKESNEVFYEERLQARLGVSHFRLPPDYEKTNLKIPAVRFPRWHYCPVCRTMEKIDLFRSGNTLHCRQCEQKKSWKIRLIPVRFVTLCSKGHIDDFPFNEWVHKGKSCQSEGGAVLKYSAGKSSTLGGIKISCSCGAEATMQGAFNKDAFNKIGIKCKGRRPWLGQVDDDYGCGESIQATQRGASNIYFPIVYSSIYLPLWAEKIDTGIINLLENPRVWEFLTGDLEDGTISKDKCKAFAISREVDPDKLHRAAVRKFEDREDDSDTSEESFRYAEYEAFLNERGGYNTDLYVDKNSIGDNEDYEDWMGDFIESIVLVEKLRETRALGSFTRLIPSGERDDAGDSDRSQKIKISDEIRWLPAIIVRGEGIFIEFKEDVINKWITRTGADVRIQNLMEKFNRSRIQRGIPPIEHDAKFFLLHTFAHVLIKQLCFDCGYGSAALRERIYCEENNPENKMQGVLVYTAAGDSEGTMGGLVRQGEAGRIENILKRALQDAMWCGADPICIGSPSQGTDNSNLAACHNCVLLPETSCEQGNRFLDRSLLVGFPEDRTKGFFHSLINSNVSE